MAASKIGLKEIPCVFYPPNTNQVTLLCQNNEQQEIMARMDTFDYIDIIREMRSQGQTESKIAEFLSWSRDHVAKYVRLINKIAAPVLEYAKEHQQANLNPVACSSSFTSSSGSCSAS
jgi:hypothetical protein